MIKKKGLLTKTQIEILKLRLGGLSQVDVADKLHTTRQNISTIERRAKRNIHLAEETIQAFKELNTIEMVHFEEGTHLMEIPSFVVNAADGSNIKLRADFTRIYNLIKFKLPDHIARTRVIKPFKILIFNNGDIDVYPE